MLTAINHHGARDFVPAGAGIKVPVLWQIQNPQECLQMGKIGHEFAKTQT